MKTLAEIAIEAGLVTKAGGTATNITFNSASTAISALFANAINGETILPYSPHG